MHSYWKAFELTVGQRPVLLENEVELRICQATSIYFNDDKKYRNGTATLTTHRILWLGPSSSATRLALSLEHVTRTDQSAGFLGFSSPKVYIYVQPSSAQPHANKFFKLSFHEEGRDDFLHKLNKALVDQAWLIKEEKKVKRQFTTSSAGINGIMRQVKKSQREEKKLISEATSDLDALMKNAAKIVSLSAKISAVLEAERSSRQTGGSSNRDSKGGGSKNTVASRKSSSTRHSTSDDKKFVNMLQDMGISSPVTRHSAGSSYHTQLSRQLCDFLRVPLDQNFGGMIPLTDLFCVFNRARGTELISPDDLLSACSLFETLGLPLKLRKFESGVTVVQSPAYTDEAMSEQILEIINRQGPLTAVELSQIMNLSLMLAQQHCLNAERAEYLCRDQSIQGVRFYKNIFI